MGWFDEQIRSRKKKDNEVLEDAFLGIAGAIVGKRLEHALEEREIANSAISEILKYYHVRMKTEELPREVQTLDDQLEFHLRPHGIMHREVKLDKGWYKSAAGPMLGTLREDGSAIALIPGIVSGYTYYDFKTGKKVKLNKRTEKLIDDQATCFYMPLPLRKVSVKDLLLFVKDQIDLSDILIYFAMMAVTTLLGLLSPVFVKWLFGSVLESKSTSALLSLATFMISFTICRLMLVVYQTLMNDKSTIKQGTAVESAVMSRLMSLPPSFFKEYSSGELTQRALYIQALCSSIITAVTNVGFTSVFSLIYIGQIFAYAPELFAPAFSVIIATVLASIITTLAQMKIRKEQMLLSSKESGMSYSMITGIQKIKLAGAEKRMFSRWAKLYSKEAALEYNPPLFLKISPVINLAISLAGDFVLFFMAVKANIGISDFYAFNTAYGMVSGAFMSLASIAATIANFKPTLDMIKPILEAEPEISDGKVMISSLHGGIEMNNVTFRYSDDTPNVIDDLTLKIRPGEYVAIVGKTGCGKSTLMRLLLGFETPKKGAIYYDRQDITRVDLKSLRRKIGTVMQDGKLFMGDIYSNIVISAPQLTLDDAWEAAEIACIADDIREMPMEMHTMIAEGQGGISGGQKQRLMIARAIAPKPKILMFDEATSALDNVTQRKISEAIDKLKCTRIVIAHRLSTIRHCDRIIVLDKGKIIEEGKYEDLIEKNGFFAELVARQRLDVGAGEEKN